MHIYTHTHYVVWKAFIINWYVNGIFILETENFRLEYEEWYFLLLNKNWIYKHSLYSHSVAGIMEIGNFFIYRDFCLK